MEQQLADRGAILRGHFQLSSGRHADTYVEKFRILQWPDITGQLCAMIADHFRGQANVVAGPTTGGVILAYETARHLGTHSIIAEKREDGPGREFKRGFELGAGDRVLVVDDVLTTGGSVRDVLDAVRERGATVAGVGMLVDRTGGKVDFGVPFFACFSLDIASWAPEECALCKQGIALTIT
ncbi:MAG: orotate phosphoribosyltransferase [Dehalococcoidia bacterium]|nr:orotate phosphoribosyltransferase [Dehalococcoidia bacterium]